MKSYHNLLAIITVLSSACIARADVTMSASLTQIDDFDCWTISLSSGGSDITSLSFKATAAQGGSFNKLNPMGYHTIYGHSVSDEKWAEAGLDKNLDTHFLLNIRHSNTVPYQTYETDSELATVISHIAFSDAETARIVVPRDQKIDIEIELIVSYSNTGYSVRSNRNGRITDTDLTDNVNLITQQQAQDNYCTNRATIGDFNCDLYTNLQDLDILGQNFGDPDFTNGDANGDGRVGLLDLDAMGPYYNNQHEPCTLSSKIGDLNCDLRVNLTDLNIISNHYGKLGAPYRFADTNGDGEVGIVELDRVHVQMDLLTFGVPEPASLALLSIATLAFIKRRQVGQDK